MKTLTEICLVFVFLTGKTFAAENVPGTVQFSSEEIQIIKTLSPLPEVKADPTNKYSLDAAAAAFGENLFNDWRLSKGEEFACQTCHRVTDHFMSVRNDTDKDIPTLWNMAYNKWFFWDGRADSLWAQALGPIENPKEHNSSRTEVATLISEDINYKKVYIEIFGDIPDFSDKSKFPEPAKPSSDNSEANGNWLKMKEEDRMKVNRVFANIGKALAAFQMTLTSQKTDFDVFVEGLKTNDRNKIGMLSDSAKRGLKIFIGKGQCIDCHSGPSFTDSAFHDTQLPATEVDLGFNNARQGGISEVKESIFNAAGPFSDAPHGEKAKLVQNLNEHDKHKGQFKTPGLRNVTFTAPFMHTGQFRNLKDVIDFYSEMKNAQHSDHPEIKPLHFNEQEKTDLINFLKSISSYSKSKF